MLSRFRSSGYSQSASLLAHNKITAPQFIRKNLHFSWYKQVLTHCLLLFATLQGTYLIQLNITEHKSHIREQARYAGLFSRPPSSIGSALNSRYSRIHHPIQNASHTTTYVQKKRARKGGARGGKTGFATLSAFPLANFRRENNSRIPHAVSQRHTYIHTLKCNTFNH